jgi:hypothetical protein
MHPYSPFTSAQVYNPARSLQLLCKIARKSHVKGQTMAIISCEDRRSGPSWGLGGQRRAPRPQFKEQRGFLITFQGKEEIRTRNSPRHNLYAVAVSQYPVTKEMLDNAIKPLVVFVRRLSGKLKYRFKIHDMGESPDGLQIS